MKFFLRLILFIGVVFILPTLATVVWWSLQDRPVTWREAQWGSANVLEPANANQEAAVYVMAARTGGMKGAFSLHCWIVLKRPGAAQYERYDKVGWGSPIRKNAYPADAYWYSNSPQIVHQLHGAEAEAVLANIDAAIADYPFSKAGDYHIWPGPNSNSFVAHIIRSVPQMGARMPSNAVGRDYAPGIISFAWDPERHDFKATLGGLLGIAAGAGNGLELQFLGLVAGMDFARPALLVPAYGRLDLWKRETRLAAGSGGMTF